MSTTNDHADAIEDVIDIDIDIDIDVDRLADLPPGVSFADLVRSQGSRMERITTRIPEDDVDAVEALVDAGEYPNRSEVIRSALDALLAAYATGQQEVPGDD